jgi:phage terminase large subunit-like protein
MTYAELLEVINDGIKQQVKRPNLYAYVPHTKQHLFHQSTSKTTLYIGGNRSGKTTGGAAEAIYRLIGRHPYKAVPEPPVFGRVHSVDFKYGVGQIIIPEIVRWLPPSFLKNGSWEDSYDRQDNILTLANKSKLEFKSYEQDLEKFAGTSRNFNWYDEEPPKHIYNESQARLIDVRGDCFITMTPVEGMTWVYEDIYLPGLAGDPNIFIIEIDMSENPHLDQEAREDYLRTLDPDERAAREKGEFIAVGGRIFKSFNVSTHVQPFFIPPKNWQWFVSFDHGYNNPTAILWHAVSPKGKVVTFFEHYASEMVVKDHAAKYHSINNDLARVPDFLIGDKAMAQRQGVTGTSILQEYADHGVYIGTRNSDVLSGLNRMISYLKQDQYGLPTWTITDNCVNLITEMRKYRWETYSSRKVQFEKNKQETPHKKDDHAIDSARYFFTMMPDLAPSEPENLAPLSNVLGAPYGVQPGKDRWDEMNKVPREGQAFRGDMVPGEPDVPRWKETVGTDLYSLEY